MKSTKRTTATAPTAKADTTRWFLLAGLLALALALFEIYRPALGGPFLFDDVYLPFLVPNFAQNPLREWVVGVRPTLQVTYWLNYKLFGLDAYYYHLFNLVLHAATGYFVWLIARKLLSYVKIEPSQINIYSAFAAAVFLLHPLQSESVGYVASRSEVLSGLFFVIAWSAFLYRQEVAIRFSEVALVLVFFVLAVTSKEHTAVLPAVLLLTDYFFNPGFTFEGIRRNWRLYIPVIGAAILGAIAIFKLVLARSSSAGFGLKDLTATDYLFTQFRSIVTYLRFFFLPLGQNIDHDFPISRSLGEHLSWLCLLILLVLIAAAWIYRKRFPLAAFGFLLFLIFLAPTSSFVPIRDVLVERRMYLPIFALTLCVIEFVRHRRPATTPLTVGLTAACLVLAVLAWQRNQVWAGPLALWQDSVVNSPQKYRPRFQLAYAHYESGQCLDATRQYAEAAKLTPIPTYDLYIDWALAADCAGKTGEALTQLENAIRLESSAHAWSLVGMVRAKQGDYDRALEALAEAEKRNSRYSMLYNYRGNIYMAKKDFTAAAAEFQKALTIEPGDTTAKQGFDRATAAVRRAETKAAKQP